MGCYSDDANARVLPARVVDLTAAAADKAMECALHW
jgi:hypothetical protein